MTFLYRCVSNANATIFYLLYYIYTRTSGFRKFSHINQTHRTSHVDPPVKAEVGDADPSNL